MQTKPLTKLAVLAAALGYSCASTFAGTFTSDFSNPSQTGFTLNGGTRPDGVTPYPTIEAGHLALTYNENSEQASIVLDDLDGGAAIESFTVDFKLQIGPGSGNAADGTSFSFGPDVTSASLFGEEGTGNGIIVAFDIYDNGGGEAPAIEVKYGGNVIAHTGYTKAEMVTSKFEPVTIQLTRSGAINLNWKGSPVFQNLILPGFIPSAGQFAIGARTGGENANQWIDDLHVTTKATGAAVKPAISADPKNAAVAEHGSATFSATFDGSAPLTFQWSKNNVPIPDATGPSYTAQNIPFADNGAKFKVTITNPAGNVSSAEATLAVTADTTKPIIASVFASDSFKLVTIVFSEPVTAATAGKAANYSLSGGLTIVGAPEVVNPTTIRLTTSAQALGTSYMLTVNNVNDTATNPNTIAAGSTQSFSSFVSLRGGVKLEVFQNVTQSLIDFVSDQRYIDNNPDVIAYVTQFTSRLALPDNQQALPTRENYFGRLSGWIVPPSSGDYEFFIRSDDASQLYLSTDDKRENAELIAEETGCCDPFQEPGLPETSTPHALVANKRYYIYAILKEGGGGDYCDVAYRKVGDTTIPRGLPYIPGAVLETIAAPGTFTPPTVAISSPANGSSFDVGAPVTLTATATATAGKSIAKVEFYELSNKVGEATTSPFSITLANLTEDAHKYTVRATDSAGLYTDSAATTISVGGLKKKVTLLAIDDQTVVRYDRSGRDLGTAWREKGYDDGAWPQGKTLIADETTTTVEPIRTAVSRFNDDNVYVVTFYFRTHFNFSGAIAPGVKLQLRHAVDDGAVFYLNGKELHRFGLAAGAPYDFTTLFGGHENAYEGPFDVPTDALVQGDNVLAAEVHQSSTSSSDMVYGAELIATIPAVTTTLFAIDDSKTWRYDRTGRDLGTDWRAKGYDDAAWPQGKTLIADETTTTVEPIRTAISRFNDDNVYVVTFYFRSHFNFPGEVAQAKMKLRHAVDDGAVFYINGTEVHRFGLAADASFDYLTLFGGHENAYEGPFDIPVTSLVPGDNVMAVEVHQSSTSSSDMVFGAELSATYFSTSTVAPPTIPKLNAPTVQGGNITITWINGGTLESATAVAGPWVTTGDSDGSFSEASTGAAKFYRVRK